MISIIIPVYNGEAFIQRSLNNVLAQTFKDWELIVIDDGSTDSTPKILTSYKKYSNIKIIHKKNGGVSSARNVGIDNASGEYITFIDADDIVEPTYLGHLNKGYGYDMVVTGFCYGDRPQHPSFHKMILNTRNEIAEELLTYLSSNYFYFPWARMFRRDILINNSVRFNEKLRFGEDHLFNWTYLGYISSIMMEPSALYHKKNEEGSGSGYSNLSLGEINYLDKNLFLQKEKLEKHYGVILRPAPEDLFHISFMKDFEKKLTSSFCAEYYRKYHPSATMGETYGVISKVLYHRALHDTKEGRITLEDLDKFLDEPTKIFFSTKMKSRFIIPFVKIHAYRIASSMISKI